MNTESETIKDWVDPRETLYALEGLLTDGNVVEEDGSLTASAIAKVKKADLKYLSDTRMQIAVIRQFLTTIDSAVSAAEYDLKGE